MQALASAAARAESLEEAWSAGLYTDQQLEASRWDSSAAQRGLYAAEAERWVSVDGTASYYVLDKSVDVIAPLPIGTASLEILQREGFLSGVHATQPLYTFGRIQSGIDAAGAEVTAALSQEATSELDVLLRVATAYINVLKTQRLVEVAEQAVESLASQVRDVKNRVDQGVGILNDQLAAEVALADAQQELLRARARLDIANAAYNRSVGRPLDILVDLDEMVEPSGDYDLESLTQLAMVQRPEIAALSAVVRALRSRAHALRAGYKPQFALRGGWDFIENRNLRNEGYASLMVVGQWNMFDTGRKHHQAARLEQSAEAILRRRSDIESIIRLQVRDAWRELETTRQRVQVNRATLKRADENLRVAKNRYDQGAGTNTEVLDAETLRSTTYGNYYTSLYDALQALMQLSRAAGDFGMSLGDIQPVRLPQDEVPAPEGA
jgi:outer membrane protein TolC